MLSEDKQMCDVDLFYKSFQQMKAETPFFYSIFTFSESKAHNSMLAHTHSSPSVIIYVQRQALHHAVVLCNHGEVLAPSDWTLYSSNFMKKRKKIGFTLIDREIRQIITEYNMWPSKLSESPLFPSFLFQFRPQLRNRFITKYVSHTQRMSQILKNEVVMSFFWKDSKPFLHSLSASAAAG